MPKINYAKSDSQSLNQPRLLQLNSQAELLPSLLLQTVTLQAMVVTETPVQGRVVVAVSDESWLEGGS